MLLSISRDLKCTIDWSLVGTFINVGWAAVSFRPVTGHRSVGQTDRQADIDSVQRELRLKHTEGRGAWLVLTSYGWNVSTFIIAHAQIELFVAATTKTTTAAAAAALMLFGGYVAHELYALYAAYIMQFIMSFSSAVAAAACGCSSTILSGSHVIRAAAAAAAGCCCCCCCCTEMKLSMSHFHNL